MSRNGGLGGLFSGPIATYESPGVPGAEAPTTHLVYATDRGFSLSQQMALHPLGWALGLFAAGWAGGYLAWVQLGKRGYSGGMSGTPEQHWARANQIAKAKSSKTGVDLLLAAILEEENVQWAIGDGRIPTFMSPGPW